MWRTLHGVSGGLYTGVGGGAYIRVVGGLCPGVGEECVRGLEQGSTLAWMTDFTLASDVASRNLPEVPPQFAGGFCNYLCNVSPPSLECFATLA